MLKRALSSLCVFAGEDDDKLQEGSRDADESAIGEASRE